MPYPTSQPVKVKIAGSDRTAKIPVETMQIVQVITRQIDTATFTVRDADGLGITELDTVVISNTGESTRYFAGYITKITKRAHGVILDLDCVCSDYTFLLDRVIVNTQYEDTADSAIISNLFSTYLSSIEATTYVETLNAAAQIPLLTFNRVTLKQAVQQLADMGDGDWYIDYGPGPGAQLAYLHYFGEDTNAAPYNISDSPDLADSFPVEGFSVVRDATNHVNLITVVGGDYLSDDTDFIISADGTQTVVLLAYEFEGPDGYSKPRVYKNTNDDVTPTWSEQTVGLEYVDDPASYNVLFNKLQKHLVFAAAPSQLDQSVKVTARYEVPLRQRVRNQTSYDSYGLWLEDVLVDADIVDKTVAKERAKGELERRDVHDLIKGTAREPGLIAGQRIKVTNTPIGIDSWYNIQRIVTRFQAGGMASFDLEIS